MSDYVAKNVLVGVGTLKLDGVSVGYTSGGVTLTAKAERVDKEVDQSYAPIGIMKVRESFGVQTNLAEATLENLKLVWEQTASIVETVGPPDKRTMAWGMNQAVVEHTLEFKGKSPEGLERKFSLFKVVVMEVGDMAHQKDKITLIPVTFRVLPDVTKSAGEEYGSIVDFDEGGEFDVNVNDSITKTEDGEAEVV
jgi:hypothetical protein